MKTIICFVVLLFIAYILLFSHHTIEYVKESKTLSGIGSWYDYKLIGRWGFICHIATEDCYTAHHLVGASRDFKKGTLVKVCRVNTNKCVGVLITDYIKNPNRIIDLSSLAFSRLAPLELGLINVNVQQQ